jgi:hypothetical protein
MLVAICMIWELLLMHQVRLEEAPIITLAKTDTHDSTCIEVTKLSMELLEKLMKAKPSLKEWQSVFRVVVGGGTTDELLARTPVCGTYSLTETGVRFDPQFPLVPGLEYVVILRDRADTQPRLTRLALPKPPSGPRVGISAVYPTGYRLPENTLRWYIHFTGPVTRGNVYRYLKLIRDDGVEVKEPFLEVEEELWSADGLRLTVFFHPGRVKRGLLPRLEEGPILEEGRSYTLVISARWPDTEGRPLRTEYSRSFTVGPPDDEPVGLSQWSIIAPPSGSEAPLIIRLPKRLDHAMLGRVVGVEDSAGQKVQGVMTVGGGERVLSFTPTNPWLPGEYKLVTDTRLEDVCGNRVGEPFEVDDFRPVKARIEVKYHERPFRVR